VKKQVFFFNGEKIASFTKEIFLMLSSALAELFTVFS
jgi:hypothetical protein